MLIQSGWRPVPESIAFTNLPKSDPVIMWWGLHLLVIVIKEAWTVPDWAVLRFFLLNCVFWGKNYFQVCVWCVLFDCVWLYFEQLYCVVQVCNYLSFIVFGFSTLYDLALLCLPCLTFLCLPLLSLVLLRLVLLCWTLLCLALLCLVFTVFNFTLFGFYCALFCCVELYCVWLYCV